MSLSTESMHSFFCAACILATCSFTLGLIEPAPQPPTKPNDNPVPNVGPSAPSPATTTLPPVAELTTTSIPLNSTSSPDQCRCSGTPGPDGQCIAYNKRWQANTVDEAIEFFRSPLDFDPMKSSAMTKEEKQRVKAFFKPDKDESKETTDPKTAPNDVCENDMPCKTCMSGVYYLLAVRAAINGVSQNSWAVLYSDVVKKLAQNNGIPFALVRDTCKQSSEKMMTVSAIFNVYNEILRVLSCKTCMDKYSTTPSSNLNTDGHRIAKRQTVGTTIQIRCDYRRGQLIGDGTNYVGMCNLCWTVRQLPAEYSPRMLNEITCSGDTTCLAGYGQCRARYRATNVMYIGQYEVSINAQSGCECQVVSGSAFFPYVNA